MNPIHCSMLRAAALLVPRPEREEWLAEWMSELWYLRTGATAFCLGAFQDAVWLRRNTARESPCEARWLRSPGRCLGSLAALAAVTAFLAFRLPGVHDMLYRTPLLPWFFVFGVALLILPAVTTLSLGDYPVSGHAPRRMMRLRRWIFLGVKLALLAPIVFCGIFDLTPILGPAGLQPHAALVGYVLAFRWALADQRKRCPVCLRSVTSPASIGQPASTFLEWYGTEFLCAKGHGLLYVPKTSTISLSTQRWLYLDPSWKSLF